MKLSVSIITYNHERFIRQALDSVLMQDVSFDYEVVVGDDYSTDSTRDILLSYQRQHPGKIRLRLADRNHGAVANFVGTLTACVGEYTALLEGDDYWTSPDKLQIQAEFLDSHPECAICFHNCEEFYEDGTQPPWNYCSANQKQMSTLEDLLKACNFIPTCSATFRSRLFGEFPAWYFTLPMGDWTLHILNAEHGGIGYINQILGRHRVHAGGMWSLRDQVANVEDVIRAYDVVNAGLNYRYRALVSEKVAEYYLRLADLYGTNDIMSAVSSLVRALETSPHKLEIFPTLALSFGRLVRKFLIRKGRRARRSQRLG